MHRNAARSTSSRGVSPTAVAISAASALIRSVFSHSDPNRHPPGWIASSILRSFRTYSANGRCRSRSKKNRASRRRARIARSNPAWMNPVSPDGHSPDRHSPDESSPDGRSQNPMNAGIVRSGRTIGINIRPVLSAACTTSTGRSRQAGAPFTKGGIRTTIGVGYSTLLTTRTSISSLTQHSPPGSVDIPSVAEPVVAVVSARSTRFLRSFASTIIDTSSSVAL